jgi:hypothetical protein
MTANVRFAPESGHWLSVAECPLCANAVPGFYLFPFWSHGTVRAADRGDIPALLFLTTALAGGVTHPNEVAADDFAAATSRGEYENLLGVRNSGGARPCEEARTWLVQGFARRSVNR